MAAIFILQRFVNKLINLKNINIANWPLHFIVSLLCCAIFGSNHESQASTSLKTNFLVQEPDTLLPYPWNDRITDQWSNPFQNHPLYLSDPSNIENSIEYDPINHEYNIYEKMGDRFFRNPSYMTFQEYTQEEFERSTRDYWKQKSDQENAAKRKGLIPKLYVGGKAFDRIFGGNTVDIRPQGSAELIFGLQIQRNDNPALPERQRRNTNFDFQQKIQMNVIGNIGDKLKLQTNYNTEASFEFENRMKLEYTGYEDEIIQKIEAGNVTLPLTGTLIQGSQSLFGLKTELRFGRLNVTSIFSQQKGQTQNIQVKNGAQTNQFQIQCDEYEVNKHYFLSQYFADNYDNALRNLPVIQSQINITRIEVWVTNRNSTTSNTRNIVAFQDMGEPNPYATGVLVGTGGNLPDSAANNLYMFLRGVGMQNIRDITKVSTSAGLLPFAGSPSNFTSPNDYEKLADARLLQSNEYTLNSQLGYISLNRALNADEILAVAFEYTVGNQIYRVGELSTQGVQPPQALLVKLLKSRNVNTSLPIWDLMMKNVYNIGAYQLSRDNFKLDILYYDDNTGSWVNYIPVGKDEVNVNGEPLLRLLNLDKLNTQNDPQPDGVFDFVSGLTVNANNGRIIFPVREPFGSFLESKFVKQENIDFYVYQALYDTTRIAAQQQPEKNKFQLRGEYQSSSSSDISLNAINIPQGSVKVTAGSTPLTENVHYTVDYNLGRVKIIDQSILNGGAPINIRLESNSLFSIQSKTLLGSRFDYKISDDFALGATILHLNERPITRKINVGDEPIKNTIWGFDGTYRTESRLLTKMVDRLPFIETKEKSTITITGEFAHLIPGHARALGKAGTAYVDDFEGSTSTIDLRNPGAWSLSSVPQGQPELFPEALLSDSLPYGFNRAKLAWYRIDPLFYRDNNLTPDHLTDEDQSNNFIREVPQTEIFPFKEAPNGQAISIPVLNMAYYPSDRGPYNFDAGPSPVSAGVTTNGKLADPKSRWAGMMRRIESSDFETANVEFIQFWMMDPFNSDNPVANHQGGDLYFNLGNISEDILRDARRAYENGLPSATNTAPFIENNWGRIPTSQAIVNAFDNDPDSRDLQDVGFDGLPTTDEQVYFQDFINNLFSAGVNPNAVNRASADPSSDDFRYFRGDEFDAAETSILNRYKQFNGPDGNSPVNSGSFVAASTNLPDDEDVNRDNTLDDFENYYQYKVKISPNGLQVGQNYIVDKVTRTVTRKDNSTDQITWYQFKIPIRSPDKVIGSIQDFNSIRFIRMFMTNFEDSTVLRMARLELVRGEWRRYQFSLLDEGEQVPGDDSATVFDILTVNLEENGDRTPINYVIPNGIDREINPSTNNLQQLNEQSLVLRVCNLKDGDARAAYKNTEFDMRLYKRLRMFIHAEAGTDGKALNNGDITCFIRLGADFNTNFYEYEISLSITPNGTKDADLIWPEGNELDLELSKLIAAKTIRNKAINIPGSTISLTDVYQVADGKNTIRIKGSPNLGNVRMIMIGIRNPDEKFSDADDGLSKCAEVWVNELRMTDFDEKGGWAANARITAKLADFGTVTLTGGHQTIGFGGIEQKLQERRQSDLTQYDLSTTLQLGKFFGDNVGLSIPMYFGYAESFSNPRFNPLDPDVEFSDAISDAENTQEIKTIKKNAQEYNRRKGLNFTNVRKNKTKGGPPRPWDISNWNATYAFTETYRRDINTEYDLLQNYKVALGYNYNTTPKNISPFQKSKLFKKKAFTPIRDFNFYLTPSSLNFRTDIDRQYGERLVRSNNDFVALRDTFFNKSFNWTRLYDFKFDLTKSLQFDFNANNIARIDEPAGKIDQEWERDSIRESFRNLGRNINYTHSGNARYNVPLNKFPILNWVNVNTQYGFNYSWTAAPLFRDSAGNVSPNSFGNTIQNSNTVQVNGQFNMVTLYNKVPLFKKVNRPPSRSSSKGKGKDKLDKKKIAESVPPVQIVKPDGTAKTKKEIRKEERKRKKEIRKLIRAKRKELRAKQPVPPLIKPFVRLILAIKNMSFTYSETNGTALPGYVNESQLLGQDLGNNSPGLPFAFGSQEDVRSRAARDGWLTGDSLINSQYTTNNTTNFTARSNIEPIPGFRIDLNANRTMSNSLSEFFRADATGEFQSFSPVETGNFSMSFMTWNTAFINDRKDFSNKVFDNFTRYRETISKRLAQMNPNSSNAVFTDSLGLSYRDGYGPTQQEVLTYAFIAAYKDDNPETTKLNPFPKIPIPNWRVTYDGLSKLPWAKKLFNNISLSHGYRSSYNINSFRTNISYGEINGSAAFRDNNGSFIPELEIQQISISEQFAPLIGVDITWKNSLFTRVEFKKDRSLSLTFTGIQMTEIKGDELTIGVGYRLKKFTVPFKIGGKKVQLNNDLNLSADVSIRRNKTIVRRMQEQTNVPTAGLNVVSIKTAADYIINDRFNIRFFYDRTVNTPLISTSFPTATTNAGVSIRFTLAQ